MITVLFLCTGNSARSILAEAMLNDPSIGGGRFRAYSAGSHPRGVVHPLALAVLREHHIRADGLRSKSWDEFTGPSAPPIDAVITVCDNAAAEPCPLWPGHPVTAHWSVPDPATAPGTGSERAEAFRQAMRMLRDRIERLTRLPQDTASRDALRARLTHADETKPA